MWDQLQLEVVGQQALSLQQRQLCQSEYAVPGRAGRVSVVPGVGVPTGGSDPIGSVTSLFVQVQSVLLKRDRFLQPFLSL